MRNSIFKFLATTVIASGLTLSSAIAAEVKIRCCNQISSEDEGFKAMQLGTVDGFFITANNVSPHWPLMDVTVLPYVFQNKEHLERVVDGPVGDFMKQRLQADTSVHLLTFGPALYRDFYNSVRPINTMADMKGLKIRVPKNATGTNKAKSKQSD